MQGIATCHRLYMCSQYMTLRYMWTWWVLAFANASIQLEERDSSGMLGSIRFTILERCEPR